MFTKYCKLALAIVSLVALNPNLAWANEAVVTSNKAINLDYQIAYKNPGQNIVYGSRQHIEIAPTATIPFDAMGYKLVGIVPLAVNGHTLPSTANQFDQPMQCSLTTDKTHDHGALQFFYEDESQHHGRISCAVRGGIFG